MEMLTEDFNHILHCTADVWPQLKDKTIFITGGTGFFGIWFQMSFVHANRALGLNSRLVVLTRNKDRFLTQYDFIRNYGEISFVEGDICSFDFPDFPIHYIIHAATEASVKLNLEEPMVMFETIIDGTRRALELARQKNVEGFLLTSSGAVYGPQPSEITHIEESYLGAPVPQQASSVYGEGKRMSEVLCAVYKKHYNVPVKVARCFAFVGPFLPMDTHFAIGNFIKNLIDGKDIAINGDGTPYRSYMYASDLMIWLWTILVQGQSNIAYNVGSDDDLTIEELAHKVINAYPANKPVEIKIAQPKTDLPPARYVPNIGKAEKDLGLKILVDLSLAIHKTATFAVSNRVI